MHTLSTIIRAGDGERFTPRTFERVIGTEVDLRVGRRVVGQGRIRDVQVTDGGASAVVIFETGAIARLGEIVAAPAAAAAPARQEVQGRLA